MQANAANSVIVALCVIHHSFALNFLSRFFLRSFGLSAEKKCRGYVPAPQSSASYHSNARYTAFIRKLLSLQEIMERAECKCGKQERKNHTRKSTLNKEWRNFSWIFNLHPIWRWWCRRNSNGIATTQHHSTNSSKLMNPRRAIYLSIVLLLQTES